MLDQLFQWLRKPAHLFSVLGSLIPIFLVARYMYLYMIHVPVLDHWWINQSTAVAIKNGTFAPDNLFIMVSAHWHFFSRLITAITTVTTDWDVRIDNWTTLIFAGLSFMMLGLIFHREAPHLTHRALIPLSCLIFYVFLDKVWLISLWGVYLHVNFFMFCTLYSINYFKVSWQTLLLTTGLTLCAHWAFGTGMLLWGIVPILMFVRGYRSPLQYAFWAFIAGATILLFLRAVQADRQAGEYLPAPATAPHLLELIEYQFLYLGSGFTQRLFPLSRIAFFGFLGLLLGFYNLFALWQRERRMQALSIWLGLMLYSVVAGVLIGLGRIWDLGVVATALQPRYITISMIFWIVTVSLMIINHPHLRMGSKSDQSLYYTNLFMAGLLSLLYVTMTFNELRQEQGEVDFQLTFYPDDLSRKGVICLNDFVWQRSVELKNCPSYHPKENVDEYGYQLAAYRLSIFADQKQTFVLPEIYHPGQPIVITSPSIWLNLVIREYLLQDVDEDSISHVAPLRYASLRVEDFPNPPDNVYSSLDDTAINAIETAIANQPQVWYITTPETAANDTRFFELMASYGYTSTLFPIEDETYRTAKFSIYGFQLN